MSNLIVFDVETTGKDQGTDQIVEFAVRYGLLPKDKCTTLRMRPLVQISPGAQKVHGISMEDVKKEKTFKQLGNRIKKILESADVWVGYNIDFDINILQAEFKRNGFDPVDLSNKIILDPYKLWREMEPRGLEHAYAKFVGKELEGAHAANVDTTATAEVLVAMLKHFKMVNTNWEEIALICEPERASWIGPSRHFKWDDDGKPVLNFGSKHCGDLVTEIADTDVKYLSWIVKTDFPAHVKEIAYEAVHSGSEEEFIQWLEEEFGSAPSETKEIVKQQH